MPDTFRYDHTLPDGRHVYSAPHEASNEVTIVFPDGYWGKDEVPLTVQVNLEVLSTVRIKFVEKTLREHRDCVRTQLDNIDAGADLEKPLRTIQASLAAALLVVNRFIDQEDAFQAEESKRA